MFEERDASSSSSSANAHRGSTPAEAGRASVEALLAALRDADRAMAGALGMLGRLMPSGAIERETGLPSEIFLTLAAGRPGWEARALTGTAAILRGMPHTAAALAQGRLSWPVVYGIAGAVRRLDQSSRDAVDQLVASELERGDVDPDALADRVHDEAERRRADLVIAREDRRIEASWLALQPRVDGSGGSLYAQADAEAFAVICEAIDAASPPPVDGDEDGSRARQRLDGLVRVCETSLTGASADSAGAGSRTMRPRPRFLLTLDARDLEIDGAGSRLLWRARGRAGQLSRIATETLLCDAQIQPVIFEDGRPISVGDVIADVSARARAALIARDQGCRFPGCSMPAAWTDAHHVKGRGPQTTGIDDLVLLCRRCHRRVHRHRWKITIHQDGSITFRLRGKNYTSPPRISARE